MFKVGDQVRANRVVHNLNTMDKFWPGDYEEDRLDDIQNSFKWVESPEGSDLWLKVHIKQQVKFEDIPPKPRAKKAQPHVIVPAMVRPDPVVVKKAEAPVKKEPAKKVGWW